MATTAQSIVQRAATQLMDTGVVHWTALELVQYLNDGQHKIVEFRPDATATDITFTCVAGAEQTLPSNAVYLIDVSKNLAATSRGRVVKPTSKVLVDNFDPDWEARPGTVDIIHFMYDIKEPRKFYVYPPALSTTQLNLVCPVVPTNITEPAPGAAISTITGNISVDDIYANALRDYVLYRAYSKEGEAASSVALAKTHYEQFTLALSGEFQVRAAIAPRV